MKDINKSAIKKDDSNVKERHEKSYNSTSTTNTVSFLRSLNSYKNKENIKKILKDFYFQEGLDYFNINKKNKIIIGKTPHGPKFDKNSNIIPYSFVGPNNLFSTGKKCISQRAVQKSSKTIKMVSQENVSSKYLKHSALSDLKKQQTPNHNYKIIDENTLKRYYGNIKKRIDKKNNSEIQVPKFIKECLSSQQVFLKKIDDYKKQEDKFKTKLSKKCHKSLKELLLIKSNDFQYKTQDLLTPIKKKIVKTENNKDDFLQKANLWNLSLRNPLSKKGKYDFLGYQNSGPKIYSLYSTFNLNKAKNFFHNHQHCLSLENIKKLSDDQKRTTKYLNNINSIKLSGKNLLETEMEREIGFNGKKILFMPNEIDTYLYKEKFKKDINNVEAKKEYFGQKTFAENYNATDFYDNKIYSPKYMKTIVSFNNSKFI